MPAQSAAIINVNFHFTGYTTQRLKEGEEREARWKLNDKPLQVQREMAVTASFWISIFLN